MNALTQPPPRPPLLSVRNLSKHYTTRAGLFGRSQTVFAVDNVSFHVGGGETLGLVGESGCGKSTIARTIMRLVEPTSGEVTLDGQTISNARGEALRQHRRQMQMVFQDPASSLNSRMRAIDIVGEPLRNFGVASGAALESAVAQLFEKVGLRPDQLARYPHEFSGGQRQRLGIARALALRPKLIICDEPVSALDVSVQAQIINLLRDLQAELNLSYVFVAHDIAVVEQMSHRIAVMYLGRIVEIGAKDAVLTRPSHPYTRALLGAIPKHHPSIDRKRALLRGDPPNPSAPPPGCAFSSRCPMVIDRCRSEAPKLLDVETGHQAACHLAGPVKEASLPWLEHRPKLEAAGPR